MEIHYQVHDLKEVLDYFEKGFQKRKQDASARVINRYIDTNAQKVVFEIITTPLPDSNPG